MTFKLEIDCDNAAFENPIDEIVRLLHKTAERLERDGQTFTGCKLLDFNGNSVGKADLID